MTEKRFENRLDKDNIKFNTLNPVWDNKEEDALNVFEMIDLLNKLADENKIFREALKELKEIGDYQAARIKELDDMNSLIEDEIDKKIAILTDAEIKSIQNEDKVLFGKIKFGIQVLRELKEVILND